jgi:hypothetical protein
MRILADTETQNKRWDTCKKCENLTSLTKQCKLCHCFMKVKVKFKNSTCPDKPPKWEK